MKENTTKVNVIDKIKAELDKNVAKGSNAIIKGKLVELNEANEKLKKLEKDYNQCVAHSVYVELLKKDNPIEEAIKTFAYEGLKHREKKDKETGKSIGLELIAKTFQIDLLDLCEFSHREIAGGAKLNTAWQYSAARLNQLLCLRAATMLKCTEAEINDIAKSYYLKEQAAKISLGETPMSDTQICKALQKVIDEIIFVADEKGKNKYKCNNHDVAYLIGCYTKHGKKPLTLAVSKDNFFRSVIMEICLRILENGKYSVDGYKKVKENS